MTEALNIARVIANFAYLRMETLKWVSSSFEGRHDIGNLVDQIKDVIDNFHPDKPIVISFKNISASNSNREMTLIFDPEKGVKNRNRGIVLMDLEKGLVNKITDQFDELSIDFSRVNSLNGLSIYEGKKKIGKKL